MKNLFAAAIGLGLLVVRRLFKKDRQRMIPDENVIWGFEDHYLALAKHAAKELFARLDQPLNYRVFLVGLRLIKESALRPVCVVPFDTGYGPEDFTDVVERAAPLREMHHARSLNHSDRTVEDYRRRETLLSELTAAVRESIGSAAGGERWITYCSRLTPIDEFVVATVLQLDRADVERHVPRLERGTIDEYASVLPSLVHAAAEEYVGACRLQMNLRNAVAYVPWPDTRELLRQAATKFMVTPAAAGKELNNLYGLFDACNAISALPYEGQEGHGRLLIARRNDPAIRVDVRLAVPVEVNNYRAVRKLLEISSDEVALLSDAAQIYGLGSVSQDYDPTQENVFEVRFVKHFTWVLLHAGERLMHVGNGEPSLPRPSFDIDQFRDTLRRVMPDITEDQVEHLVTATQAASRQRHGTMLVITPRAAEEAERLARQATPIDPKVLDESELDRVTRIDGAVLVDPGGVCHAIGVILDGMATERGNPARGARYNSAIRYAASQESPTVVVVISEDGMIDFFANEQRAASRL